MKGLILKDILNLKRQYKVILVMLVFYVGLSAISSNNSVYGAIISFFMVMLTITSISYDERSKWDTYALTMPVTRNDIVLGKYVLGIILSGLALLINFVCRTLSGLSLKETLGTVFLLFGISILFLCVILPFIFKYGTEKGRLIMMIVLFTPMGVIMIMSRLGLSIPEEDFLVGIPYVFVLVLAFALIISIKASLKIYGQKEM